MLSAFFRHRYLYIAFERTIAYRSPWVEDCRAVIRSCALFVARTTIMASISKVTVKYQSTIPREVREFLGVRQGTAVAHRIEHGEVTLKRVATPDSEYRAAVEKTRTEWASVVLRSVWHLFDHPLTKGTRTMKEPTFPRRRESNLVGCHQILTT